MAFEVEKGTLYVVPTPIGNLGDMTERALTVLKNVDFVAAEDTRVSGKLLNLYGIEANFVSYHEHNKASQGEKIVERLKNGESGAIVTDAGTPAVSDPGEDLVAKCRENGVNVVPLPGACAFVTALAGSGFPSRRFCFEGFLPTDKKERSEILDGYKNEKKTVVFYEAPHRVAETAKILLDSLGNRRVCAARELTKLNEEFFTGSLSELCDLFEKKRAARRICPHRRGRKGYRNGIFCRDDCLGACCVLRKPRTFPYGRDKGMRTRPRRSEKHNL